MDITFKITVITILDNSKLLSHATATVALAYMMVDVWDCSLYWWVFSACSCIPATIGNSTQKFTNKPLLFKFPFLFVALSLLQYP